MKKIIGTREQLRVQEAIWAAAPTINWIQVQHLIVLYNKYGRWRLMVCFSNWGIDNLDAIALLRAFKHCELKPGANRPFRYDKMEELRRIV